MKTKTTTFAYPRCMIWVLILLVTCCGSAWSQQSWDFGGHRFLVTPQHPEPLMERPFGRDGLRSFAVLSRIGGVNLEGKVSLPAGLRSEPLRLDYDPSQPDGRRLIVTIAGKAYRPWLPDWQLKPIALLADSQYTASVSLFGNGPNPEKFFYIQFHPALKDTLLGLRLLQADVILIDPDTLSSVPTLDGRATLGVGEQMPNEAKSAAAAETIKAEMAPYAVQSWVLTDIDSPILLTVANDNLRLDARPYYYFWTTESTRIQFELLSLRKALAAARTQEEKTLLRLQEILLNRKWRDLSANAANDNVAPQALGELTSKIASLQTTMSELNPLVWGAVLQTTRFAGLFRLVRTENATSWNAFIRKVSNLPIPVVETPTQWLKR